MGLSFIGNSKVGNNKNAEKNYIKFISKVGWVYAILAFFAFVGIYFYNEYISNFIKFPFYTLVLVGLFCGYFQIKKTIFSSIAILYKYFNLDSFSIIILNFIFVSLLIVSNKYFEINAIKNGFIFLSAIWIVGTVASYLYVKNKYQNNSLNNSIFTFDLVKIKSDSFWLSICSISFLTWAFIDKIFGQFLGLGYITFFSISTMFYQLLSSGIGGVYSSVYISVNKNNDIKKNESIYTYLFKVLAISSICVSLLIINRETLFYILSVDKIDKIEQPIKILLFNTYLLASIGGSFAIFTYKLLATLGESKFAAFISLCTIFINIITNIVLLHFLGPIAIPLGLIISQSIYFIIAFIRLHRTKSIYRTIDFSQMIKSIIIPVTVLSFPFLVTSFIQNIILINVVFALVILLLVKFIYGSIHSIFLYE